MFQHGSIRASRQYSYRELTERFGVRLALPDRLTRPTTAVYGQEFFLRLYDFHQTQRLPLRYYSSNAANARFSKRKRGTNIPGEMYKQYTVVDENKTA